MSKTLRVPVDSLRVGDITLKGDAAHYALRVHRLAPGDAFVAFDPALCLEAEATVITTTRDSLVCRVAATRPGRAAGLGAWLVQCIGKGDKVDDVVRAATALGVAGVVLAESARTVVKLGARAGTRVERWSSVALEAARQSGRGDVPRIEGPFSLDRALGFEALEGSAKLALQPRASTSFGELLEKRPVRVSLLVGPEGGFTEEELELARGAGFELVSFGVFELRTELAGVAALGALLALQPTRG